VADDEAATRRAGSAGSCTSAADIEARALMLEHAMRDTPSDGLDFNALAQRADAIPARHLRRTRQPLHRSQAVALKRTVRKVENANVPTSSPTRHYGRFHAAFQRVRVDQGTT